MEFLLIVSFLAWACFAVTGRLAGKHLGTRAFFSVLEFGALGWVLFLIFIVFMLWFVK